MTTLKSQETALVTGAGRGLGLEFVRQLVQRGAKVFATARSPEAASELQSLARANPERLTLLRLDVTDEESIRQTAQEVRRLTSSLDLLINNAGVYIGRPGIEPGSDRLGKLTMDGGLKTLLTNAIGPMVLTQELLPLLRKGRQPKIVSLTSGLGSIANSGGAPYHYSASKAALNMYMHGLAGELRGEGIICVVINPGWVATDMGGQGAALSAEQSARGTLNVVDKISLQQSGGFFDYRGQREPW